MGVKVAIVAAIILAFCVAVLTSREGDLFGNCHVYGNGQCGPSAPWHGFTGPAEEALVCDDGFRVETVDGRDYITCGWE
jgi:hypothetical protein